MFDPLREEVIKRFTAVESFFKAAHTLKGDAPQIARGLAFVQMYAVYEYSTKAVMRTAVDLLISHNLSISDLAPPLLALFLDPELQSLKDCSHKDIWGRRLKLFNKVFSSDIATVENTLLPHDGTHFRHTQLQVMFEVLGIKRLPAQRKRHLFRIDEVVHNRNGIAHGLETPENVGRRYSRAEILHAIKQIKSVCLLVISLIEAHCADESKHRRK